MLEIGVTVSHFPIFPGSKISPGFKDLSPPLAKHSFDTSQHARRIPVPHPYGTVGNTEPRANVFEGAYVE